jgi:hypothetical protein
MTDYSDLVKRLRGKKLNCICAAKSASECCCNTDWPESSCNEAADAIELLQRELKCANELWEQQKELALEYLADIKKANERIEELKELLMIANNDFFNIEATTFDMKSRIAELEAALKPFADASDLHLGSDDMSIAFRIIIGELRQARKVLEYAAADWEAQDRALGEKE